MNLRIEVDTVENFFQYFLLVSVIGSVAILLIQGITFIIKDRYTRTWRYLLWIILTVRLLLPFDFSIGNAPFVIPTFQPLRSPIISNTASSNKTPDIPNVMKNRADADGMQNVSPIHRLDNLTARTNDTSFIQLFWDMIIYLWLIGIVIHIIYYWTSYSYHKKTINRWSVCITKQEWIDCFYKMKDALGIRKKIELKQCSKIQSPMLIGWRKPTLLLPKKIYTNEELVYIFKHEFIHVKRKDIYTKTFFMIAKMIHWFNPFVNLMVKEAEKDIELLCDETVTEGLNKKQRILYNELILKSMKALKNEQFYFSTSLSNDAKIIKERMTENMKLEHRKKGYLVCGFIFTCLILSIITISSQVNSKTSTIELVSETEDSNKSSQDKQTETVKIDSKEDTVKIDIKEDTVKIDNKKKTSTIDTNANKSDTAVASNQEDVHFFIKEDNGKETVEVKSSKDTSASVTKNTDYVLVEIKENEEEQKERIK